ncbi:MULTISPECIES: bifunctional adenosylcobinamide kinase/adenosylcobinamide-phosphate guanylyltransferase [Cupriavidus]|jgi:adenosylcobinamide kinase/adenosylcobinamide-phosphate guanylyltransferase|uniref:bifunctional adenosylcobinamide kinase/adenosylcobinamide-phosphate guanylyltransferase n=1 Tax=unclassified Cupriavidus TaxID=2640874 RepID=UPI0008E9F309|nr:MULTISPECIES: bifunctional adenosylcobinamide kinase/adenosylcobinamide-phosphate guanylyltransferase [unclassified Cupriavidus]SFB80258.1 adenosylcobinamide kinase /adenosylcobinamide-phosphate guanylyltransferase [Cupriavidus sp. OV038]SFO66454.1 adenosylcobinamide kinase /adenosylcobinamide-phosphate guanylyltransferase [Cupriavidus sp. OV096]
METKAIAKSLGITGPADPASAGAAVASTPETETAPQPQAGTAVPRMLTLVLGGARSGKSHFAEQLATDHATLTCGPVTYIATARHDAEPADEEMELRIALHRARRPADWALVEEPVHLADALYAHARHDGCILVDCVTLWLNNLIFDENRAYPEYGVITPPPAFTEEIDALLTALPMLPGHVILVSNEIGFGVVPTGAITRFYVDELGRLNQKLAAAADRVRLLVAGIPVAVKGADPA